MREASRRSAGSCRRARRTPPSPPASAWCTSISPWPTTSACSTTCWSAPSRCGGPWPPRAPVGERRRVEILKALYRDARILILDEPTAVLTPQETDSLFATLGRLVAQGLSILVLTHKLNEVMAVRRREGVMVAAPHGRRLRDGASLTVRRHEIVAIAGVSGNGQAALAGLVAGTAHPADGRLVLFGAPVARARPGEIVARGVGRGPAGRPA